MSISGRRATRWPIGIETVADRTPSGSSGSSSSSSGSDLAAIEALATTGICCRVGVNTWALRAIAVSGNGLSAVVNPYGVAGNPTISLDIGTGATQVAAGNHTHAAVYEPVITAGTTAQYWRGDKTWQTLNQAAVAGLTAADSPALAGLTLSGLTASLPVVTNGSKALASMAYATFKTNLSLAQADISGLTTANTPQFAGIKVQQTAATALNRIYCYSATAAHFPEFSCLKSHSDTVATVETVNTDVLGMMRFLGVNTTPTANYGAYIQAIQNGAAGTYVPTDLRFYVYDSSAPHAALALTKSGGVHVGGTSDVEDNALLVDGKFGCNGASVQAAYASGGALAAYGTGAYGLDSDAHMQGLYNLVVAIRAALVANGIMS